MTHGDDQGLVLPPELAPIQVVIVPIYKNDEERSKVLEVVEKVKKELKNYRVKVDDRPEVTPGYKFNDWELKGVPLRIEIGPKDIEKGTVVFARRDILGKPGKSFVTQDSLSEQVGDLLKTIQQSLYDKALNFRLSNTYAPETYQELNQIVQKGWAMSWWCESEICEAKVKEESRATTRCLPLDQPGGEGKCIVCGNKATKKVVFAKAY
jgi:prolyl-tRNA synthetase